MYASIPLLVILRDVYSVIKSISDQVFQVDLKSGLMSTLIFYNSIGSRIKSGTVTRLGKYQVIGFF